MRQGVGSAGRAPHPPVGRSPSPDHLSFRCRHTVDWGLGKILEPGEMGFRAADTLFQ